MEKPKNPYPKSYWEDDKTYVVCKSYEHNIWQECAKSYEKYIEEIVWELEEMRTDFEAYEVLADSYVLDGNYVFKDIDALIIKLRPDKE